jgi:hypothetical protein
MPDLHQTLRTTDLDFLQRIARAWGIDLSAQSFSEALTEIEAAMKEKEAFSETVEVLPEEAQTAWKYLLLHHGRESWAVFTRKFGELRVFGPARRVRENPDLDPVSPVETLWYRGLIGSVFLKLSHEPQEYAYIPDEFFEMADPDHTLSALPLPRPATESETKNQSTANDGILDHATELLAALRMNRPVENTHLPQRPAYLKFLTSLLTVAGFVRSGRTPEPEKVRDFLTAPRGEALLHLYATWRQSKEINDLVMLPGILCDGAWVNDPLVPRTLLEKVLLQLDTAAWWSIPSLLSQLKSQLPDFQRPAGDYDSWFIRDEKTNEPLRGFENWDKVDGALLRYLIGGPLFWLGVVDIARASKNSPPQAFRISVMGQRLLKNLSPSLPHNETGGITVSSDGTLYADSHVPRVLRYQLGRFCEPVLSGKTDNKYHITANSLRLACDQDLHPTQLTQLLQQNHVKNIPQSITESLERWEKYGSEIQMESVVLLRLDKPELMPIIQKTPRISRCLGDILNNKTAIIKPGCLETLKQALAEIGLLTEVKID